ncbi:MAG: flagellar hook-associated protein FlgK [Rhodocyclaceae bacterium]|jgi:flagellar hook-associated protein 1 FlgK|uniref:Flagellar hook-associated protein 1 n=1 Tax=Candidatus Desulfobacillus denitrificans TaxID=2608985 RepID=A0A809RYJ5_9PROT|nr:flagellar hook-associated protein FlgK [Candidatus Desulfobacillus denitrificans]GIK46208.1 MAG: flagellar hook-associated protein FlgK [Betaproteobacteria bacterium]GJQ56617.1 MAG: flagellar hook-associated protein FlgK [Rhodocyclaceae bacterium]
MGSSVFNIGVSGLAAAQAGLLTTGHNISNASTPGFNRQQIVQSTNTPQFTGAGYFGQGTNVQTVQRIYNQFLASQTLSAQTRLSELNAYADQIRQVDGLLADSSAGLSTALNDFFRGVHEVAANPASIPARQSMLSMAQALVGRFQSVDNRLNEIRDGVDTQLASTVADINSYTTQIAALNQRIILAQAAGPGQPANDLLDQRDQLIAQLNQQVRVTTLTESDGSLSVFVGNGQAVVVGAQSYGLATMQSGEDASRMTVGITLASGGTAALPEAMLTGGTLGGLLAFRRESLDTAQNALGRIALGLAETFNAQHRLGQDLTGALGGNFFTAPAPQVITPNNPPNGGTAAIGVAVASAANLTTSDYRLTANGGGNYTLVRLSDNTTVFSATALPQTVDGLTISLASGAANAGDSFLIQPTRAAAHDIAVALTDARSIAAAAPIRTAASNGNSGTGAISAGSVNAPPPVNANLTQTVTITFNNPPTTFDVVGTGTGNPAGVAYTAGGSISYNGWTVEIGGTPAAGDVFTISANSAGVADNRNALLLAGLQTGKTLAGGTASYQSAYAQIVSDVGNKTREIQVTATAQESVVKQAEEAQQSLSGVNLDEEAANLLRYQQAYQASGKMIEIADKLFNTLLELGR